MEYVQWGLGIWKPRLYYILFVYKMFLNHTPQIMTQPMCLVDLYLVDHLYRIQQKNTILFQSKEDLRSVKFMLAHKWIQILNLLKLRLKLATKSTKELGNLP